MIENNLREISVFLITDDLKVSTKYIDDPWSFVNTVYKATQGSRNPIYYITTDLSVITENNWKDDLKYQTEENSHHEPRLKLNLRFTPDSEWIINLGDDNYIAFLSDWRDYDPKLIPTV